MPEQKHRFRSAPIGASSVRRGLRQIYRSKGRNRGDLSRLDRAQRHRLRNSILIGLGTIAAVTLIGFFVFTRDRAFSQNVLFAISAPTEVASGEEATLQFRIENRDEVTYTDVEVTARMPETFSFLRSVPDAANEFQNVWEVGSLPPGSTAVVTVVGQLLGDVGSTHDFEALLSYQPQNFSSTFQTEATHAMTVTSSVLTLDVNGPGEVITEAEATYTVTVTNASDASVESVKLTSAFPSTFTFISSDPDPTAGETPSWELGTLESGAERTVTVNGRFRGDPGDVRELTFLAGIATEQSRFNQQSERTHLVVIAEPQLIVALSLNNAEEQLVVGPGETVEATVHIENSSEIVFRNVQVQAVFESTPATVFDFSSVTDPHGGSVFGNAITWDEAQVESLGTFAPGESVDISFAVSVREAFRIQDEADREYAAVASVTASSTSVGDLSGLTHEQQSNIVRVQVGSQPGLTSEVRYFGDELEQLGTGPHPPVAGETTTYRVLWVVTNTTNTIEGALVRADLPAGVSWVGSHGVTAGELAFDSKKRQVTWTINRVPEHTGLLTPALAGSFTISISPDAEDVGEVMQLLEQVTLSAEDSFTETSVSISAPGGTTALDRDPGTSSNGTVQPADE